MTKDYGLKRQIQDATGSSRHTTIRGFIKYLLAYKQSQRTKHMFLIASYRDTVVSRLPFAIDELKIF